jgi:hypothetical protein
VVWEWQVLQHPPHILHLAPSDFYLFWPFKNFLSGEMIWGAKYIAKDGCAILHIPCKGTLNTTMKECLNT